NDDALVEGDETVIVTLNNTDNALFTIDAGNNSDTVTIGDNDSSANVSITANDASADEAGSDPGQFTVDLGTTNNTGGDVTVNYTVTGTATDGGTDYSTLTGSVVIANGAQTATIDVNGINDDALVEGDETVIVTLDNTDNALFSIGGSNSATVTIGDNDSSANVSITANDASADEAGSDPGQFTVDLG
ncbi:MAG: hypothetical protein GY772_24425, partial [bacterium]|nr:hypothetical protein [bacterium]